MKICKTLIASACLALMYAVSSCRSIRNETNDVVTIEVPMPTPTRYVEWPTPTITPKKSVDPIILPIEYSSSKWEEDPSSRLNSSIWTAEFLSGIDPYYYKPEGFMISLKKVLYNNIDAFEVTEMSGSGWFPVIFSSNGVGIDFEFDTKNVAPFEGELRQYRNIVAPLLEEQPAYAVPDTEENRKIVSQLFRYYINDELVLGALEHSGHKNLYYLGLALDKNYTIDEIDTLRVELCKLDQSP